LNASFKERDMLVKQGKILYKMITTENKTKSKIQEWAQKKCSTVDAHFTTRVFTKRIGDK
jgi:hypothetical protein